MAKPKDKRLSRLRELRRKALRIARRAAQRDADAVAKRYYKRARFWLVRIRNRREFLEEQAKETPGFKPWMLNGRPGNIEPQVQAIIALAVTQFGLAVTSTSTGPHTPSSYHFPWNNPRHNGKGRGVDLAGSWKNMVRFYNWTREHKKQFDESFGPPNNHFIKKGREYSGAIPNHFNHNHVAPVFGARF